MKNWKRRIKELKTELRALYLAYKDPRTPWYAKIVTAGVVAYAFSPILGHLDDLIIVPLGILLALKLIPAPVLAKCRAQTRATADPDEANQENETGS